MAKEPDAVEDLPAPKAPGGPGGKSSLLPAIITIAAIPIIMALMWEFYMMPSIKKMAAGAAGAEGGEHAMVESASHEEAPASHGESSGHGKGEHGEGGSGYELKDIVANLSGQMRSRYIKVSFVLEGSAGNFKEMMASNEVKIRDATLAVLSELTIQDLEEPGVKNIVRNNIISSINQTLRSGAVEQLYFSEFVVQ